MENNIKALLKSTVFYFSIVALTASNCIEKKKGECIEDEPAHAYDGKSEQNNPLSLDISTGKKYSTEVGDTQPISEHTSKSKDTCNQSEIYYKKSDKLTDNEGKTDKQNCQDVSGSNNKGKSNVSNSENSIEKIAQQQKYDHKNVSTANIEKSKFVYPFDSYTGKFSNDSSSDEVKHGTLSEYSVGSYTRDFFEKISDDNVKHSTSNKVQKQESTSVSERDNELYTLMIQAVKSCDKKLVEKILSTGVNINVKDKCGFTSLHWAYFSDKEIFKLLLERGADITVQDKYGFTLLHWAAFYDDEETVKLLLERGADITVQDKYGLTPIHWAIKNIGVCK